MGGSPEKQAAPAPPKVSPTPPSKPKRRRRLSPAAARLTEIAAAAPENQRTAVFGPAARAARSGHRTRAYALLMSRDLDFFAVPDFFPRRSRALAALFPPPPAEAAPSPAEAPPLDEAPLGPRLVSLTPAQRAVLAELAAGPRTAGEVAAALGLSAPAARSRLRTLERRGAVCRIEDDEGAWTLPGGEGPPAE